MLKRLEQKELIVRRRDSRDERNLIVELTEAGEKLKEKAVEIPYQMAGCVALEQEDAKELYRLLNKVMKSFE